jgi:hypothetical protein
MSNDKPFDYGPTKPGGQHTNYPSSVKLDESGAPLFVQPIRDRYRHKCGAVTTMRGEDLTLTYATNPGFYGATFCWNCGQHRPLVEFTWLPDGAPMTEVGGPPGADWRGLETVPKPAWQVNVDRAQLAARDAAKALSTLNEYAVEDWEREQIEAAQGLVVEAYEHISTRIREQGGETAQKEA